MSDGNRKDNTGRTVAVVGAGALLLWLLLRGKGWGGGAGSGDGRAEGGDGRVPASSAGRVGTLPPCRVRIDGDGLQLDGAPASLAAITERCRATGSAEVRATGAAITGVVAEVMQTLQAAGVRVWAAADVWNTVGLAPTRRPA